MTSHPSRLTLLVAATITLGLTARAGGEQARATTSRREFLEAGGDSHRAGRLASDPARGPTFVPDGGGAPIVLEAGMTIHFEGPGPEPASGMPPFRIELGLGQRISGRLAGVTGGDVSFIEAHGDGKRSVVRAGVHSVVQRPGESLVLDEGFEALETSRWTVAGAASIDNETKIVGAGSARIPAGGSALTYKVADPYGSGRFEAAFHDSGATVPGEQWSVELTFRGQAGRETVRAVLGWSEESLIVESPGGPALAVQRLARKPGWRRLGIQFGPDRTEVSVDGDELAHGKGLGGPLVEVRIGSLAEGKPAQPQGLAGHIDDLRLVRFNEPSGSLEIDATQDEVRLSTGDQLFGRVRSADAECVNLLIDGADLTLPWSNVSGLYFRRASAPGAWVSGTLARVEWRVAPGEDPRDTDILEGALTGVSSTSLTFETPYSGILTVSRPRVTSLRILGRGARLVIDPAAHHLGDEITTIPPFLDPPQPEGGVLERSFELAKPPDRPAFLVLDVIQVVGESPELPFSSLVKKGELRTNVKLNGSPFDYLNRYITTKNETRERIRLPIPKGLLRAGKNIIRLEQTGIASDPNFLDDLGILCIALELDADEPGSPRPR